MKTHIDDDWRQVKEATVVKSDLMNTNGVIHVIDKVLMPEADEPAEPLVQ